MINTRLENVLQEISRLPHASDDAKAFLRKFFEATNDLSRPVLLVFQDLATGCTYSKDHPKYSPFPNQVQSAMTGLSNAIYEIEKGGDPHHSFHACTSFIPYLPIAGHAIWFTPDNRMYEIPGQQDVEEALILDGNFSEVKIELENAPKNQLDLIIEDIAKANISGPKGTKECLSWLVGQMKDTKTLVAVFGHNVERTVGEAVSNQGARLITKFAKAHGSTINAQGFCSKNIKGFPFPTHGLFISKEQMPGVGQPDVDRRLLINENVLTEFVEAHSLEEIMSAQP